MQSGTAYKTNTDFEQERRDAIDMLARSVTAIDQLSSKLEFVAFQTGAKVGNTGMLLLNFT